MISFVSFLVDYSSSRIHVKLFSIFCSEDLLQWRGRMKMGQILLILMTFLIVAKI